MVHVPATEHKKEDKQQQQQRMGQERPVADTRSTKCTEGDNIKNNWYIIPGTYYTYKVYMCRSAILYACQEKQIRSYHDEMGFQTSRSAIFSRRTAVVIQVCFLL